MNTAPVLEVENLRVSFWGKSKPLRERRELRAVKGVDFSIARGETLGLVGESGSGKSTVARALMRLIEPTHGTVVLEGEEVTRLRGKALRRVRQNMQMVFQDPYSSLDPSITVAESIAEPLEVHHGMRGSERDTRVIELLELVGLAAHHAERYPYEFSGGQRQRIAIARALALNPSVVVCDEAVSALDVSTQNQIIRLLEGLQSKLHMAYLFISHDLAVVRHISDRVAVMYFGEIVEMGDVEDVFQNPRHPYTAALLAAVPVADPETQRSRHKIPLIGEIPDIARPPRGCAFASRCPIATERCQTSAPLIRQVGNGQVACHYPLDSA